MEREARRVLLLVSRKHTVVLALSGVTGTSLGPSTTLRCSSYLGSGTHERDFSRYFRVSQLRGHTDTAFRPLAGIVASYAAPASSALPSKPQPNSLVLHREEW